MPSWLLRGGARENTKGLDAVVLGMYVSYRTVPTVVMPAGPLAPSAVDIIDTLVDFAYRYVPVAGTSTVL